MMVKLANMKASDVFSIATEDGLIKALKIKCCLTVDQTKQTQNDQEFEHD